MGGAESRDRQHVDGSARSPVGADATFYDPVLWPEQREAESAQLITPGQEAPPRPLNFYIKGRPAFAYTDLSLAPGQKVLANGGAMLWMNGDVSIRTHCHNGICAGFWRSCAAQSCCLNTFTAPENKEGRISFGFELPGDMLPFLVTPGDGWIVTAGGFVAGTENLIVDSRFAGCLTCMCAGEGLFFTRVRVREGDGMFFAGGFGTIERIEVPAGKTLFVDHGLFFAAHMNTNVGVGLAAGVKTCICGDEGFVMQFKGPAIVYTQSRDESVFGWGRHPKGASSKGKQKPGEVGGAEMAAEV